MEKNGRRGNKRWLYSSVIFILLAGYIFHGLTRSIDIPSSARTVVADNSASMGSSLAWPTASQSAVKVLGSTTQETHNKQTPVPIASVAKVITALTVLEKYPLKPGEQGPTITLTDADVALYNNYAAQDGSVMKVVAGEKITEYQMLQAIMLPSANNVADSLAIWAYGSLPSYAVAANDYLVRNGLSATHAGSDASGLSPSSTSTAKDISRLGELAMRNPVLTEIASQKTATNIPVVGTINNVNFLLGESGIVGIKTGNSDQAGGAFLGASKKIINGSPVTIVTAVLTSNSLYSAMKESLNLTDSAQNNFRDVVAANQSIPVGGYTLPWGGTARVIPRSDLVLQTWSGAKPNTVLLLRAIDSNTKKSQNVGSLTVSKSGINNQRSVPVYLESDIPEPSIWWRLTHPF